MILEVVMRSSNVVQKLRRAAVVVSTAILAGGVLLAAPQNVQAVESSADLITSIAYTTPTTQFALRNEADDKAATFVSGDGNDVAALTTPFFNDIYTLRLYHTAISLIPTVSAKAEWSCAVSGDGTGVDADCSVSGLTGGDEATIVITVTAENDDTNDYTFNVDAYGIDATLSDLTIDNGTLTPAFNSGVFSYTAITGASTIDIDPTENDGNIVVDNDVTTHGDVICKKSSVLFTDCDGALAVGSNTIVVTVTAENGVAKQTYTVTVTRVAETDNTIMALSLSHGGLLTSASTATSFTRTKFSSTVVAYDLTSDDTAVTVTVDLKNEDGTFDCTDTGLPSGSDLANASGSSCTFDLTGVITDGSSFTITVHPESGATTKAYVFAARLFTTVTSDETPVLTPAGATVVVGQSITFDPTGAALVNDFTGETRVMYQWYLCDSTVVSGAEDPDTVPAGCVEKASAVGATYTPGSSDVGKHLIGALIAQPGSVLAYSASKEVTGSAGVKHASVPPVPEEAALAGAEIEEEIVLDNITLGDFTGITDVATQVGFKWYRCTAAATAAVMGTSVSTPTGCSRISGATDDSYSPALDADPLLSDAAKYIRARLLIDTGTGSKYTVFTRTTSKVAGPAVNTAPPGAPKAPTLTPTLDTKDVIATNGTWSGFPTPVTTVAENYSYQWYACNREVVREQLDMVARPDEILNKDSTPRCYEIGEVSKTLTATTEFCAAYLLVGVAIDNTDFRGMGGTSEFSYSLTSASLVGGSACTN